MTMIELCVHMCCPGCQQRVRKSLAKLQGIDSVDVDMVMQKVTVTGYVEQKKVLKAVRRTGRRAVLWPYPYAPEQASTFNHHYYHQNHPTQGGQYQLATTFTANPFAHSTASSPSYNYRKHGYDDDQSIMHGHYGVLARSEIVGDRAGDMFSDDNPNACSVM